MKAQLDERDGLSGPSMNATPSLRRSQSRTKSPGKARRREPPTSLRHTNSIELLHKRKHSGSAARGRSDGGPVGREGRPFRVGNVGNNGKIYLRYVEAMADESHSTAPETRPWTDSGRASHPDPSRDRRNRPRRRIRPRSSSRTPSLRRAELDRGRRTQGRVRAESRWIRIGPKRVRRDRLIHHRRCRSRRIICAATPRFRRSRPYRLCRDSATSARSPFRP